MLTSVRRLISYPNTDRSDRPDIPAHFLNLVNALEVDMVYAQGTDAARVARAHLAGTFFYATDTKQSWYDDGATWQQVGVLPGTGMINFTATPPSGYLICDGSAVSRTTQAALFAAIGTGWGAGDGSTTFNLPDLRGRVPVGYAPSGGHADVSAIAGNDGTALALRRPRHKHTVNDPTHTHTVNNGATGNSGGTTGGNDWGAGNRITQLPTLTSNATGVTIGPQTGSEPTDAMAYAVVNFIIKT